MKVAIGFFGQPRLYSKRHSDATRRIIEKYNMDVYCHAWWDPNDEYMLGARGHKFPQEYDVEKGLQELYSPKKLVIDKPLLGFNEHGYTDDVYTQYGQDYLWCKRFPSSGEYMSAFITQKRACSLINWDQYDFVLRYRYDFATTAFPDLSKLSSDKMYVIANAATWFDKELYDDCALITPPKFKEVWNIYDYIEDYRDNLQDLVPEHLHVKHARRLGLYDDITKLPNNEFYGKLVRNDEMLKGITIL